MAEVQIALCLLTKAGSEQTLRCLSYVNFDCPDSEAKKIVPLEIEIQNNLFSRIIHKNLLWLVVACAGAQLIVDSIYTGGNKIFNIFIL